jgi:hypothetical protein
MESHQFKYRGKTYECIGDDKDFQIQQFKFCLETRDYTTLKNRIVNQRDAWKCLIEIQKSDTVSDIVKKEKPKFW